MSASIKKNKRRRYIRNSIDLKALLLIEESVALECSILDFCNGGFFLGFEKSSTEIALNKNIKIRFSIVQEFGQKTFEIDAKVTHITPSGVGVFVENMPDSVFDALKKQANSGLKSELHDSPGFSLNTSGQETFKNSFKQLLMEELPPLISNFFETAHEELEKANEHSGLFENRSVFDDFLTTLKLNRGLIVSEFCYSVASQVDYISDGAKEKQDAIYNDSLSLIEKEDFEDWLNMSAIARRLINYFEDDINQLIRELGRVFGLSKADIGNPIGPAILCDSFREVILQLELNCKTKKALYNGFEKTLMQGLPDLYKKSKNVLSKCDSAKAFSHPSDYRSDRTTANTKDSPRDISRQQVSISQDKLLNLLETSSHKAGLPLTQVTGTLLNILNETATASPEISYEDKNDSPAQVHSFFSSDDVLSAISKIQKNLSEKSTIVLDNSALQKSLHDSLKSVGKEPKSLSSNDIRHIEVYGKFFEALFSESAFSSQIKSYLESIYLPLLSLPLQGNDFLDSDAHPARTILNQLAVLAPAVTGNRVIKNTNVKDIVEKAINRISHESITNPSVFAEVEHELGEVAKQVSKYTDNNIKRIVEPYEGRQKLEMARLSIQQEVDKRIAGKAIPSIIPLLLKSGWQDLLVIAELNAENNPDEKQKYWKVVDDLICWLYEQESMLKMQTLSIQNALKYVEDNLSPVCTNIFQRDKVVEELTALLLGSGESKLRKTMETVRIPLANPDRKASDDVWANSLKQLGVGDWMMILHDSQGFEPMKLVWIGDALQLCVFVNRDGLNKLEFSKAELADLMQSGGAYKVESLDAPLMDRATNLMLQKMHGTLIYNATHDTETDLFTRDEFVKLLKIEISKFDKSRHMLCHLEVLDFRDITNICGTAGGIQLLKYLSELVRGQLRECDLFARLGDKSFAILFRDYSAEEGYELSRKLAGIIGDSRFHWQEKSYSIGVSMGLVQLEETSYDVNELLRHADAASMSAEHSGKNSVLIFKNDDENLKRQNQLYEWIGNIDKVFSENRLFARCQMIAPMDREDNSHQHYEILLGIKNENDEIIPPDHFIPAVERCKRMPEIDRWIIDNVFAWIEGNRHYFDKMDGFSINLSGQSINSEDFLEFLKNLLALNRVPADKLTFEVTETVAAENLNFTKKFIHTIKQFGCKFSLDDFGSGYSSYSYLKNLNIDYLKIDGAFVKDILNNKADVAIVKSMNEIAHSLSLKTIAEYVENNDIRELLKGIGVDYCQGYGIHKPMPLTELVVELPETKFFSFEDTEFWGF